MASGSHGARPGGVVVRLVRAAAAAYTLFLTYALVTPDPFELFGSAGATTQDAVEYSVPGAVQHLVALGLLAVLWCGAAGTAPSHRRIACAIAALYAVVTEVIQHFVPRREFDWYDVLANLAGIGGGWAVVALMTCVPAALRLLGCCRSPASNTCSAEGEV